MSLPMRERGLKFFPVLCIVQACNVAPHAGAWIEISLTACLAQALKSLPMRERGLKYPLISIRLSATRVAPHAGAWIEILSNPATCNTFPRRSPCGSVD